MPVVISRADGGVSILRLAEGGANLDEATEVAKWEAGADPSWLPITWRVVLEVDLPPRNQDRDGWIDTGVAVVVDAVRLATITAAFLVNLKNRAKAAFANVKDEAARRDRAIALVTMDEINILRQWISDFKTAVNDATSLGDLKTKVAALPNLGQRNATQAKNAVLNRIDSIEADGG